MYRVRKSWKDSTSQLGAYLILSNAKRMADRHPGYQVYDESGKQVWPVVKIYASAPDGKTVALNGKQMRVWNQHKLVGKYKTMLDKHGCGVCCGAMAATLMGRSITPLQFAEKAVAQFGYKNTAISTAGIVTVMKKLKIPAVRYSVTKANLSRIRKKIDTALKAGKPVICWTYPYDGKNLFAKGSHYVLAVGYTKEGKVLVANSGSRGPLHQTSLDRLTANLYHSCRGKDKGWYKHSPGSAGIVIVG